MMICFWSGNKHHERPIYLESSSGCKAELSGAFVNSRSWSFIRIQIRMPHYVLRIILLDNCISLPILYSYFELIRGDDWLFAWVTTWIFGSAHDRRGDALRVLEWPRRIPLPVVLHIVWLNRLDFWFLDVKVIWNVWTCLDETILAQSPNEPKMLYAVIGRARCFASDSPFKWPWF